MAVTVAAAFRSKKPHTYTHLRQLLLFSHHMHDGHTTPISLPPTTTKLDHPFSNTPYHFTSFKPLSLRGNFPNPSLTRYEVVPVAEAEVAVLLLVPVIQGLSIQRMGARIEPLLTRADTGGGQYRPPPMVLKEKL
ncbi:hypothetical protein PIB30_079214 [Stylosanthes scabra]|uniref:Uncharacterized protein n=1 Tax=Stylosanthes scabra TaxID=79078 RepID=A0ABU6TSE9_9FABA|nr:hypothetical protein [Stylosanthes scabra]